MGYLQQALFALAVTYFIYHIYWEATTGSKRRAMIQKQGCQPITRYYTKDPFCGVDLFLENLKNAKERRLLSSHKARFERKGDIAMTISYRSPNGREIMTIEPENLKTILSKDFKKWSLGRRRKVAFTPFLGVGIFTSDGMDWQHSRQMLRPNFHRSQLANLGFLESHIQDFIKVIPHDGSTIDLQVLFFNLTMDTATEFLFGESTSCLKFGTNNVSNMRFAEAFDRCQERMWRL